MFSLRDYFDYKATQQAFLEMRKKNEEIKNLTPRQPYLGTVKEMRPQTVKVAPAASEPVKIPRAPTVKHIKYPEVPRGDVYIGRVGYIRKLK